MPARNVLMLSIDDLRSLDDWGHFAPLVDTPNLDRLAAMGTTFERAITQVPICNASRASVFTGQQPSETGVVDNGIQLFDRVDPADTLPAVLRASGAYVAMHGKNFHPDPFDPAYIPVLFDEATFYAPTDGDPALVARDGVYHTNPYHSGRYTGPVSDLRDEKAVGAAIDFLENRAGNLDQPFFLSVGITKPHLNWWLPPEYFARYSQAEIRAALNASLADGTIIPGNGEYFDVPPMTRPAQNHQPMAENRDLWVDYIHAYLAAVSYADAKIGQVLDALAADPALAAETAIVLWSDNGLHLGDHDRWEKFTPWRESTEVPLIIVDPDQRGGQSARQVVELVDLFPTVLDLMGLATPGRLDLAGRSLAPIVEDVDTPWYGPGQGLGIALTAMNGIVSIRGVLPGYGDVRYTRYADGNEELYRLDIDPNEHVNRISLATGEGMTRLDKALHRVVDRLMDARLDSEGIAFANGRAPLNGTAADEMLIGFNGPGTHVLRGGAGDDTYIVHRPTTVVEAAGGGFDAIVLQNPNLERSFTLPANVEMIQVYRTFTGNDGDNWIIASASGGSLSGRGGDDVLMAGNGGFTLDGGAGNDSLRGYTGNDTLLAGVGDDTVLGGEGNDIIAGGTGADVLVGDGGADRIRGGGDADRLTGGAGADVFIFAAVGDSPSAAPDFITDFAGAGARGGDRIDLSAIDADATTPGNQAFVFGGTDPGHLRLADHRGRTVLLGYVDEDAAPEIRISIGDGAAVSAASYTAADFIL